MNNPPSCIATSTPYLVPERSAPGIVIAFLAGSRVTDKDGTASTYSVLYGNDEELLAMNASTGVLSVSNRSSELVLDFERKSQYLIVVQATDPGGLYCTIEVRVARAEAKL